MKDTKRKRLFEFHSTGISGLLYLIMDREAGECLSKGQPSCFQPGSQLTLAGGALSVRLLDSAVSVQPIACGCVAWLQTDSTQA